MADNYLENKYAEYQARKTSGTRTGHTTKTLHKTRRVFITGGAEGIGKAIVRAFRGAGHRVAFCDKNETLGKETAMIQLLLNEDKYSCFLSNRFLLVDILFGILK